jgi:hypothetical protein
MRAAELFALVSAHGIDPSQAAKQTTAVDGKFKTRLMSLIERLKRSHIPRDVQARGRQSHVVRRAEWSLAELGQAAEGVPLVPWMAACYTYGRDRSCYWPLWNELNLEALRIRAKRGWPAKCLGAGRDPQTKIPNGKPKYYLSELCELVLDDTNLPLFRAAPILCAHYMGVEPETWDSVLAYRFDVLSRCFSGWVQTAESIVNQRLADADW